MSPVRGGTGFSCLLHESVNRQGSRSLTEQYWAAWQIRKITASAPTLGKKKRPAKNAGLLNRQFGLEAETKTEFSSESTGNDRAAGVDVTEGLSERILRWVR